MELVNFYSPLEMDERGAFISLMILDPSCPELTDTIIDGNKRKAKKKKGARTKAEYKQEAKERKLQ